MKWTIRVELTPDGNPPITYDIGTITRPIADLSPEQIRPSLTQRFAVVNERIGFAGCDAIPRSWDMARNTKCRMDHARSL
jgi:hypothetical protein